MFVYLFTSVSKAVLHIRFQELYIFNIAHFLRPILYKFLLGLVFYQKLFTFTNVLIKKEKPKPILLSFRL